MSTPTKGPSEEFYREQISILGRHLLFIDTGAIVGYFDREQDQFRDLFKQLLDWKFITSTYVMAETARRLVKAKEPKRFVGPNGELTGQLCRHLLREWLLEQNVRVLCVPESVFDQAKDNFHRFFGMGCDLGDVISYTIIRGLKQELILSPDREHFAQMGLEVLC